MKIRTSYDRGDNRRDKRYPVPSLVVILFGVEYQAKDWSLGGVRLAGQPKSLKVGDGFYGEFRVADGEERAAFRGDVVRIDPEADEFAIRFVELGLHAIEQLDGALARRFFRRRA
jgi:PilZ domain